MVVVYISTCFIFSLLKSIRILQSSYGEAHFLVTNKLMRIVRDSFGDVNIVTVSEDFPLLDYLQNFAKDCECNIQICHSGCIFTKLQSFKESPIFPKVLDILGNGKQRADFEETLGDLERQEKIFLNN